MLQNSIEINQENALEAAQSASSHLQSFVHDLEKIILRMKNQGEFDPTVNGLLNLMGNIVSNVNPKLNTAISCGATSKALQQAQDVVISNTVSR